MNRFSRFIPITILLSSLIACLFFGCQSEEPDDQDVPQLSQIELSKPASKLIYKKGDALDTTGLEVTAVYRSGRSSVVTDWTVIGFDSSQDVASQTLTVMYQENGVSRFTQYQIQYSNLSGISISHPADKLIYTKGEELDVTGLVVMASYKNGMSQIVSGWTVSGFDSTQDVSNQTLTVTYTEGDISYSVQYQIQYSNLTGISISHPADKLIYTKGEELDITGLKITASYKNGMSQIVNVTKDNVTGFDSSRDVTNQTLTVTYTEGDLSYSVQYQIQYSNLSGISVTTLPRALKYRVGGYAGSADYANRDFLNLAEMVLTVSRTDGTSETISIDELAAKELGVNNAEGDRRLINEAPQMKMVEFLNSNVGDRQWKTCTSYGDTPKTKEIYLDEDKSRYLVLTGFAFIKEDASPQINIEYTEKCGDSLVTRSTSYGISLNYEPNYKFTDHYIQDGDKYYYGDYPQTKKADDVIVCRKSMEKGMFQYYVGSDGCYYANGNHANADSNEVYFKVEPIEWERYDDPVTDYTSYWATTKIIDGGVQYYPAVDSYDRVETDMISQRIEQDKNWYRSATYNYHYSRTCYQKSALADFLNGTNESGLGLYNGKGFYQTAFTNTKLNGYVYPIEIKEILACDGYWYDTHVDGAASNLTTPDDISADGGKVRKPYFQNVVPYYYYNGDDENPDIPVKSRTDYAAYTGSSNDKEFYVLPMMSGSGYCIDFREHCYIISDEGAVRLYNEFDVYRTNRGIVPVIRLTYDTTW